MACPVKLKDMVLSGERDRPTPLPLPPPMGSWAISPPPLSPYSQPGVCNYRNEGKLDGWLAPEDVYSVMFRVPFSSVGLPSLELRRLQPPSTHTPTPAALHAEVTRLLGCQIDRLHGPEESAAAGVGLAFRIALPLELARDQCCVPPPSCIHQSVRLFYCVESPIVGPRGQRRAVPLCVYLSLSTWSFSSYGHRGPSHRASNCRSRSVASGRSPFCATSACLCIRAVHVMRVDAAGSIHVLHRRTLRLPFWKTTPGTLPDATNLVPVRTLPGGVAGGLSEPGRHITCM